MPMHGEDSLERMIAEQEIITSRAAYDIADAGTDRLEHNVRSRTPVDTNPFRHRPTRPRGHLKDSVHRESGIRPRGPRTRPELVGIVLSEDPVARLVEFDTPPHKIRPRHPGGRLRFQSRHGFTDAEGKAHPPGTWVSVEEVDHPGTKGQHMFSRGAMATESETEQYAHRPLAMWKRDVERVRTS